MNATNTETLNWQDIISGWSFTCGGEAPPEGLAENVQTTRCVKIQRSDGTPFVELLVNKTF